ncbi:MAG TPA: signal peptidase I [Kofleriaceae bacterium]|nr:signal peptidase I [Kofleriaceae bacterium]
MRAAALDRRVRREARLLVRDARTSGALLRDMHPELRAELPADIDARLAAAAGEVEAGLAAADLARVRRGLPELDELIGELPRPRQSTVAEYAEAIGLLVGLVLVMGTLRMCVLEPFKIPSSSMVPTLEINDYIFVNKLVYGPPAPLVGGKLFARSPDRGEVVVFIQPCKRTDYIKRVVGLAGDRIEIRCNVLYVNGDAAPSTYVTADDCLIGTEGERPSARRCARYRETLGSYTYDTVYSPDRPERDRAPRVPGDTISGDFPQFTALPAPCTSTNQRLGTIVASQPEELAGPCGQRLQYVVPEGHVFTMGDNRDGSLDSRSWGSVPIENIKGKALFRWLSYRDLSWSGIRWSRMGSFVH